MTDPLSLPPPLSPREFARIKAAPGTASPIHVRRLVAEVERLTGERDTVIAEHDALISACIAETWRLPPGHLAASRHEREHGWSWEVRTMGNFERTREDAVRAVRRAAGLDKDNERGSGGPDR